MSTIPNGTKVIVTDRVDKGRYLFYKGKIGIVASFLKYEPSDSTLVFMNGNILTFYTWGLDTIPTSFVSRIWNSFMVWNQYNQSEELTGYNRTNDAISYQMANAESRWKLSRRKPSNQKPFVFDKDVIYNKIKPTVYEYSKNESFLTNDFLTNDFLTNDFRLEYDFPEIERIFKEYKTNNDDLAPIPINFYEKKINFTIDKFQGGL